MGEQSLISQYYYGDKFSKDAELRVKVNDWLKKVEVKDKDGEYIYTDGDLVDAAINIMKQIRDQIIPAL